MSGNEEMKRILDAMRAARIAGDLDASADFFDDDAVLGIVGFGEPVQGKPAIRAALSSLIGEYAFLDWRPINVLVDGENVAMRHHLTLKHVPSGKVIETQTSEFLSMKDGRCRSFTQHVDTAMVFGLQAV